MLFLKCTCCEETFEDVGLLVTHMAKHIKGNSHLNDTNICAPEKTSTSVDASTLSPNLSNRVSSSFTDYSTMTSTSTPLTDYTVTTSVNTPQFHCTASNTARAHLTNYTPTTTVSTPMTYFNAFPSASTPLTGYSANPNMSRPLTDYTAYPSASTPMTHCSVTTSVNTPLTNYTAFPSPSARLTNFPTFPKPIAAPMVNYNASATVSTPLTDCTPFRRNTPLTYWGNTPSNTATINMSTPLTYCTTSTSTPLTDCTTMISGNTPLTNYATFPCASNPLTDFTGNSRTRPTFSNSKTTTASSTPLTDFATFSSTITPLTYCTTRTSTYLTNCTSMARVSTPSTIFDYTAFLSASTPLITCTASTRGNTYLTNCTAIISTGTPLSTCTNTASTSSANRKSLPSVSTLLTDYTPITSTRTPFTTKAANTRVNTTCTITTNTGTPLTNCSTTTGARTSLINCIASVNTPFIDSNTSLSTPLQNRISLPSVSTFLTDYDSMTNVRTPFNDYATTARTNVKFSHCNARENTNAAISSISKPTNSTVSIPFTNCITTSVHTPMENSTASKKGYTPFTNCTSANAPITNLTATSTVFSGSTTTTNVNTSLTNYNVSSIGTMPRIDCTATGRISNLLTDCVTTTNGNNSFTDSTFTTSRRVPITNCIAPKTNSTIFIPSTAATNASTLVTGRIGSTRESSPRIDCTSTPNITTPLTNCTMTTSNESYSMINCTKITNVSTPLIDHTATSYVSTPLTDSTSISYVSTPSTDSTSMSFVSTPSTDRTVTISGNISTTNCTAATSLSTLSNYMSTPRATTNEKNILNDNRSLTNPEVSCPVTSSFKSMDLPKSDISGVIDPARNIPTTTRETSNVAFNSSQAPISDQSSKLPATVSSPTTHNVSPMMAKSTTISSGINPSITSTFDHISTTPAMTVSAVTSQTASDHASAIATPDGYTSGDIATISRNDAPIINTTSNSENITLGDTTTVPSNNTPSIDNTTSTPECDTPECVTPSDTSTVPDNDTLAMSAASTPEKVTPDGTATLQSNDTLVLSATTTSGSATPGDTVCAPSDDSPAINTSSTSECVTPVDAATARSKDSLDKSAVSTPESVTPDDTATVSKDDTLTMPVTITSETVVTPGETATVPSDDTPAINTECVNLSDTVTMTRNNIPATSTSVSDTPDDTVTISSNSTLNDKTINTASTPDSITLSSNPNVDGDFNSAQNSVIPASTLHSVESSLNKNDNSLKAVACTTTEVTTPISTPDNITSNTPNVPADTTTNTCPNDSSSYPSSIQYFNAISLKPQSSLSSSEAKTRFSLRTRKVTVSLHRFKDGKTIFQAMNLKCIPCSKALNQKGHLMTDEGSFGEVSAIICKYCRQEYQDKISLVKHVKKVHSGERPYLCTKCKKNFKRIHHLSRHLLICKGIPMTCKFCHQNFKTESMLLSHVSNAHNRNSMYQCLYCDKNFIQSYYRNRHQKNCQKYKVICKFCNDRLQDQHQLTEHILKSHQGNREYVCAVCKKTFKRCQHRNRHMEIHIRKTEALGKDLIPKERKSTRKRKKPVFLSSDEDSNSGSKKGKIVTPKKFKTVAKVPQTKIEDKISSSDNCKFKTSSRDSKIKKEVETSKKKTVSNVAKNENLILTVANRISSRKRKLKNFSSSETSDTAIKKRQIEISKQQKTKTKIKFCSYCEKTYTRQTRLNKHIKNHHPDKVAFQPTNKNSNRAIKKRQLESQKQTKMLTTTNVCSYCPKSYLRRDSLIKHVKKHHSDKKAIESKTVESALKKKPIEIQKCQKTETTQAKIKSCSYCEKSFSMQAKLNLHIKKSHPNKNVCQSKMSSSRTPSLTKDSGNSSKIQQTETQEWQKTETKTATNLVCCYCGKSYTRQERLNKHTIKQHPNKNAYQCTVCKKTFKASKELRRHKPIHSRSNKTKNSTQNKQKLSGRKNP